MSLSTIFLLIALCALAAAATYYSIPPNEPRMMQRYNRDQYNSDYTSHLQRHAFRLTVSSTPIAMPTRAKVHLNTLSGDEVEAFVADILSEFFWAIMRYCLWTLLAWCAFAFLPWRRMLCAFGEWAEETIHEIAPQLRAGLRGWFDLFVLIIVHVFRAITQNRWVLLTRQTVGDRLRQTWQTIEQLIDDIRHHRVLWEIYFQRQRVTNWFGRHKFRLIVFFVGIHLLSTMVRDPKKPQDTVVFMEWHELQRHIDQPIPRWMFRQPLEDGSNSHYQSEDDAMPWPIGLISDTVDEDMAVVEEQALAASNEDMESGQKVRCEKVSFCRHCRQKHCCEVYV